MYFVVTCLLLMLFLPTMYQAERGIFMALVLVGSLFYCTRKFTLSYYVKRTALVTFICSIFFVIYGFLNNCPGAAAYTPVFLIYPAIYLYASACFTKIACINTIHKTIVYGGIFVMLLNLIILSNEAFLHIGLIDAIAEILGFKFGMESGAIAFSSHIEDISPYLFSYALAYYYMKKNSTEEVLTTNSIAILLLIISSLAVVLVSQTRAFWLTSIATPFLIYFFSRWKKLSIQILSFRNIVIVCFLLFALMIAINSIYDVNLLTEKFHSSFDFKSDDSNLERTAQFKSLTKDFYESPIVGHGIGWASAYVRSEKPWQYEMIYNYLLACCGIVGFAVYFVAVISIYIKGFNLIKKNSEIRIFLFPQLVGLLSVLIASETNPYLLKFDFLWTLFLPIATINVYYRLLQSTNKRNF